MKTMMKRMPVAVASLACLLSVACHGADLSRAEAKRVIEEAGIWHVELFGREVHMKNMHLNHVSFTFEQWATLKAFWLKSNINTPLFRRCQSTACENPAGQAANLDDRMRMAQNGGLGGPGVMIELDKPITLVIIAITGISDAPNVLGGSEGPNVKAVEYTWRYEFPKGFLPDGLLIPHEGKAILRRYDDGWRFDKFMQWGAAANPTGWSL